MNQIKLLKKYINRVEPAGRGNAILITTWKKKKKILVLKLGIEQKVPTSYFKESFICMYACMRADLCFICTIDIMKQYFFKK